MGGCSGVQACCEDVRTPGDTDGPFGLCTGMEGFRRCLLWQQRHAAVEGIPRACGVVSRPSE